MDTNPTHEPLHKVLKQIACACLEEGLTAEAERLVNFLDLVRVEPMAVSLIRMWLCCQGGDMQGALRHCVELSEGGDGTQNMDALQALLRRAVGDPSWRTLCDRVLESPTSTDEGRKLAQSLLDGTFGKPSATPDVASAPAASASGPSLDAFDYSLHASLMRA